MDYARMMAALRRRRWLILAVGLITTAATAFATTQMKREYQASAMLMPNEGALDPVPTLGAEARNGREEDDTVAKDRLKTVATVLTSPAVMDPVMKQNDLKLPQDLFLKQMEV